MSLDTAIQTQQQAAVQNVAYKGYADGSVEFFGDQIEVLTGYSRDQFNAREIKWVDIIHGDDQPSVRKIFVDALKQDKTYMRQYRILAQSGEVRWLQEWGQIVCSADGRVESVTGILVDITELKRIETERLRIEARAGKYLIFTLAQIGYGIQIIKIKEIIGMHPITQVPRTPEFVKGVINLRGKVIPVVDLRQRFHLEQAQDTERICIIVVEVLGASGPMLIGTVVDGVSEVQQLRGEDIEDPPRFGAQVDTRFILGMAKQGHAVVILLDIDRVLQIEELASIPQLRPGSVN